jgi:polysaccharide pyruvyl transferase WcaK-like protein
VIDAPESNVSSDSTTVVRQGEGERPVSALFEVLPEIAELDLFILGGGGILYDDAAQVYLREVALAQEHHVPVLVYAVSAGPLHNEAARTLVRDTLSRVDAVTVRERRARQLLEEVGVREIEVTADPAFLLEPDPLPAEALQREGLNAQFVFRNPNATGECGCGESFTVAPAA